MPTDKARSSVKVAKSFGEGVLSSSKEACPSNDRQLDPARSKIARFEA